MAVIIEWKGRDILKCSNSTITGLHDEITDIVRENKIKLNENLTALMEDLNNFASYGWNVDLADHLQSKENFLIFLDLVRKGIDKHYIEIPDMPQFAKDSWENFYNNLIEISKTESFEKP